jgi:hypothetical protein
MSNGELMALGELPSYKLYQEQQVKKAGSPATKIKKDLKVGSLLIIPIPFVKTCK